MGNQTEEIGKILQGFWKNQQMDRVQRLKILNENVKKGQILFTGSSLMEQFPVDELLMTEGLPRVIYNRGVGGFTTDDMLENMETMVFAVEPSRIFINIGTNDIALCASHEKLLANYEKILTQIQERLPEAEINVMAYYPVNETDIPPESDWAKGAFVNRNNPSILKANAEVEELAHRLGCRFINVNEGLTDERGKLKKEFTIEGIHMYANGYRVVMKNLVPYLMEK